MVLSTLLTVLEQQSTRWSQANKTKDRLDFFESGRIAEAFLDSGLFPIFFHLSQVNSNFAAELFCSKPRVEMVGSPTVDGSEIQ